MYEIIEVQININIKLPDPEENIFKFLSQFQINNCQYEHFSPGKLTF